MFEKVKAIPEGFHTLSPYLVVRDARGAIEFYKRAFGAEEIQIHAAPGGQGIMYALLKIGDSAIQLCDEFPGMERWVSPQKLGGTTVCLHLYVQDVDAAFGRAVAAGAKVSMPVMDMFWGDRYGKLTDPYGHEWSIATHKKDCTAGEIRKGAEEFFSRIPKRGS